MGVGGSAMELMDMFTGGKEETHESEAALNGWVDRVGKNSEERSEQLDGAEEEDIVDTISDGTRSQHCRRQQANG